MDRALTFLTHVAAQLVRRWLPPPILGMFDPVYAAPSHTPFERWGAPEWRSLIAVLRSHASPEATGGMSPWISAYDRHFRDDGRALAEAAAEHCRAVAASDGEILLFDDPRFPIRLRMVADPPLSLSVIGNAELLARAELVSIVGSRKASALALSEGYQLGRTLVQRGMVVVSGGAFGCDAAAHLGALAARNDGAAQATTLVIVAGGLGQLYPRAHAGMFSRIRSEGGAIVSERLWSADCRRHDFLARNRIIAGLSRITVVMQAATKSGALITARHALDQGRDVAVLLHPPGDVRAMGGAALLADGATGFASHLDLCKHLMASNACG